MNEIYFVRALDFADFYFESRKKYSLSTDSLTISSKIFEEPMSLVPINQLNQLYKELEINTGDPDFTFNVMSKLPIDRLGSLGRWILSSRDFAMCVRRVNNGITNIQSGSRLTSTVVGRIFKWKFDALGIDEGVQVHDSIRAAIFLVKVMQSYVGATYKPLRVLVKGERLDSTPYEEFFGCEVVWNQSSTEVWLPAEFRFLNVQSLNRPSGQLAMTYNDLDTLLDMPDPNDEIKTIIEVIKYSRFYGFPTIERVSGLVGLSIQQLQRRLNGHGLSFNTLCALAFGDFAVEQMHRGVSPEAVASSLGYSNLASFNRMFKKQRGMTPNQFLQNHIIS